MRAIFFNAKGVLYDRPAPYRHLQAFLEANGLKLPAGGALKNVAPEWKDQILRGRLSPDVYADALLKACGVTSPTLFAEGGKSIQRDLANIVLFPGVISTLEALQRRGFKLGIITDAFVGRETKIAWMRACGLDIEWDAYVSSVELGTRKPDPLLYQEAMRQASVQAPESAYVGRHKKELSGAKRVGITTIAFNYSPGVDADFYLQEFADLLIAPLFQAAA